MEPYSSAGQQATGLSSSQMASAMEEKWIQVTNTKKRKQQAHPAGPTSTPASPARPQTPPKKSKVVDKSQPKHKQTKPSPQAPGASPAPPPPPPHTHTQPNLDFNDPTEFPVTISKSPRATKAKTPYVQQIQAAPTVNPLNLVTVSKVKSSQAPPTGAEGNTAAPPAAPVKKAPGVKVIRHRIEEGGRPGGQKDHLDSRLFSGQNQPQTKTPFGGSHATEADGK